MSDLDWTFVSMFDSPQIQHWAVTTAITRVELRPTGVHVEFSKKDGPDRWPDVLITPPDQTLQYSLGLLRLLPGNFQCSLPMQYWFGLDEQGGPVTTPGQIATNWFYDSRWGPLNGWNPLPGETVGLVVAAGNCRNNLDGSQSPVKERSNAVTFAWPATPQVFTFPEFNGPPPPPPPPPPLDRKKIAGDFEDLGLLFDQVAERLRRLALDVVG